MVTRRNFLRLQRCSGYRIGCRRLRHGADRPGSRRTGYGGKERGPERRLHRRLPPRRCRSYPSIATATPTVARALCDASLGVFNEQFAGEYEAEATITRVSPSTTPSFCHQITAGRAAGRLEPVGAIQVQLRGARHCARHYRSRQSERDCQAWTTTSSRCMKPCRIKAGIWGTAQDFNGTLIYLNLTIFQNAGLECAVRRLDDGRVSAPGGEAPRQSGGERHFGVPSNLVE